MFFFFFLGFLSKSKKKCWVLEEKWILEALRVLLHLLRRCFGVVVRGLHPFSGGTWTLREEKGFLLICHVCSVWPDVLV